LAVARMCGFAVVLILALPSQAFAHGEQILVYPASTITLLFLSAVALLGWRERRGLKTFLVVLLFGVHVSLWFLPITFAQLADAMGRMFLALVTVPIGVVVLVYVVLRRGQKRGSPDATHAEGL
jgi:uncharacterized sodium:solute symporter family permease YidK